MADLIDREAWDHLREFELRDVCWKLAARIENLEAWNKEMYENHKAELARLAE